MQNGISLKKNVNLALLIFYGLGNTLGAGIYVLVGKVAGIAGLFAPIAFVVSSLVVIFTALTYAELSARYPLSAGEAVYIHRGLGLKWLAVFAGLLIFTAGIVSAATICQGFIGYLQVFIEIPDRLALVLLILTLGCIAAWGIKEAVTTAAVFTVIEIIGLLLIIVTGMDNITLDHLREAELFPAWDVPVWLSILNGAFLAVYAFLGFEDMVNVAEEVKDPQRNMPRAILLCVVISSILYAAVTIVAPSMTARTVVLRSFTAADAPKVWDRLVAAGVAPERRGAHGGPAGRSDGRGHARRTAGRSLEPRLRQFPRRLPDDGSRRHPHRDQLRSERLHDRAPA